MYQALFTSLSEISTHALHAESDNREATAINKQYISTHALHAESDNQTNITLIMLANFYPRSPCGERHIMVLNSSVLFKFLPTLSMRRATSVPVVISGDDELISTHALHAESDSGKTKKQIADALNISTHALHAESDKTC